MNRAEFTETRRAARKAKHSIQISHNGRHYTAGRGGCDRLEPGNGWRYDRPAAAETAMRIDGVGYMRRRFGVKCWANIRAEVPA